MNTTDIISGLGVFFILLAFMLSTFDRISAESKIYFIMNIMGGALAFWGSMLLGSVPFSILEGIWTVVAVIGLKRTLRIVS